MWWSVGRRDQGQSREERGGQGFSRTSYGRLKEGTEGSDHNHPRSPTIQAHSGQKSVEMGRAYLLGVRGDHDVGGGELRLHEVHRRHVHLSSLNGR